MPDLIRLDVSTRMRGPLLDGRGAIARRVMARYTRELEEEGAEWALQDIRRTFHTHFRQPTGYYESHVRISNVMGDQVVNDGGQIKYGPWLEGVGSRNAPVTRFKGYHAFRKAADRLDRRIEDMGVRLLAFRFIRRLGG